MRNQDDKKPDQRLPADLARRATAIIELPDGVLVTAARGSRYNLPGGKANRGELRSQALIREIREETGLRINSMLYLFDHITPHNAHKVYLCIAQGQARRRVKSNGLRWFPRRIPNWTCSWKAAPSCAAMPGCAMKKPPKARHCAPFWAWHAISPR
jgi:8-oxo-dGTP pyrophosphatase MutT (NUDIX family)